MRKRLMLILSLLLIVSCTGCWDLREAEETGIVLGMGLDRNKEGNIVVIAQTVVPQAPGVAGSGGAGEQKTFHNWYSNGKTIFDAVRNLTLASPNTPFWSHNKVYIISENLARQGLMDVIDFLERDPEFKQSAWILIAQENLQEIMQSSGNMGQAPAQILNDIIQRRDRNSKYAISNLGEFIQQLISNETQAYTAGVTFYQGLMKEQDTVSITGQEAKRAKELRVMNTAIFKGDKLVGWFNLEESRGLLWIQNKVEQGLIVLEMLHHNMSFEILKSNSKLEALIKEGHLIMKVQVKVDVNIGDMTPGNKLDEKHIKEAEALLANEIKKQVLSAVSRAQGLNSDVLGFGKVTHRSFPKLWQEELSQQWSEIFKDLEVEVAVEAHIRGTGLISNPLQPK
ncbi:Ger(x)C family spore germination protein [Desulfotomaculum sp. 1211_IL3151]|uniref:Ger(x)C family spore germination protein n=1 Tax=Desulfotomaculum sp. 1211_IL3151 TaxID=3084055 RepID=UPI002FD97DC8